MDILLFYLEVYIYEIIFKKFFLNFFLLIDCFKINDPIEDKGIIYKSSIDRPIGINISQNGKIIAVYSTNKISFFEIKYE